MFVVSRPEWVIVDVEEVIDNASRLDIDAERALCRTCSKMVTDPLLLLTLLFFEEISVWRPRCLNFTIKFTALTIL